MFSFMLGLGLVVVGLRLGLRLGFISFFPINY